MIQVWGTWNAIVPRDAEAICRVATMLRALGGSAGILRSSRWLPHTPEASSIQNLFASRFTADGDTAWANLRTAWTVVNRAGRDVSGAILNVVPVDEKSKFYDCYNGIEILPKARGKEPTAAGELAPNIYIYI